MATRKMQEYLDSGEVGDIVIGSNITYDEVSDPAYEDMFLRIGANGQTSLYRAPDQDLHWEDSDNTLVDVTSTPTEVLAVIVDADLTSADSTFQISGKVTNNNNKTAVMTIEVFDDGVALGSNTVNLLQNESDKPFIFNGSVVNEVAIGSIITVEFSTGSSSSLTLQGTAVTTTIKITKAQAAPIVLASGTEMSRADIIELEGTIFEQTNIGNGATGFNLRHGYEVTLGTMEYCLDASSGVVYTINHDQVFTKLTSQTYFSDGTTVLADRTFAIAPSFGQSEFSYFYNGQKIVKTTLETIQHPNTSNKQIIAFDVNGDLTMEGSVYSAIMNDAICSVITINPDNNEKVIFANERHGLIMDSETHIMLHETRGAVWATGLNIVGLANNGTYYTSIEAGTFYDEDIKHTVLAATDIPFAWREGIGGDWRISNTVDTALAHFVGGKVQYNNYQVGTDNWSLVDISDDYVVMHFFATNDAEFPFFKILGQHLHADRGTARDRIFQEAILMKSGSMPTPEMIHIGCCIIHNESTGQIEKGNDGEIWIDCRSGQAVPRY